MSVKICNIDLDRDGVGVDDVVEEDKLYVIWSQDRVVGAHYGSDRRFATTAQMLDAVRGMAGDGAAEPPVGPPAAAMRSSVVICTRDRPLDVARCLASLSLQTRAPDEIIVVDNASRTDETRQAVLAAGARYVREDRPGLDIARNTGAKAADAELVVYTDDDVVLHPRWLERMSAAFDAPDVWSVTGLVLPLELDTQAQLLFERDWGFGRGFVRRDFGPAFYAQHRRLGCPSWEIGAGASMAFRKSVFERIGYFDERLDVGAAGCSGDSEYWNRILHHGGTCRYEPAAIAFHRHRTTLDGLRRQIRAYMSGHVAALLVQFGSTGEAGNLRRVLVTLPAFYGRKAIDRFRFGPREDNLLLKEEVLGCLDGLLFMAKDRWRGLGRRARPENPT